MSAVGHRQLGEFPSERRPLSRAAKNPADKATIVSIYPKAIHERKYTVEPGTFDIPAGKAEDPGILVVGTSSWFNFRGDIMPTLEIPVSAVAVAEAVIRDCINGMLACDMNDQMPGLFFVPGEISKLEIKMKYKNKIEQMVEKQTRFFRELVRIADTLWARANGNPLTISDDMRLAAIELGLMQKPWIMDFKTIEMVPCIACGNLRNPEYPVCGSCKNIDLSHPLAKEMVFAK